MRPGRAARACIRAIERYRRWGGARGSGCRFEPSCSTYALEMFRAHPFPIAFWATAWRVMRCNPLVRVGTRDPIAPRRLRLRPNALATSSSIMAFAGLVVVGVTAIAFAQGVTGGCTATVNGQDPASMTRNAPLVVGEGQVVQVQGVVPAAAQAVPEDQVQSSTTIQVSIIEGISEVSSETRPGQGYQWGGSVNVDDYLKWGVGLYLVQGNATGTPGWSCTGSGYVRLDGNPLSKPVGQAAAAVGVIGAVGAVAAAIPKSKAGIPGAPPAAPTAAEVQQDFARDAEQVLGVTPTREPLLDVGVSMACGAVIFLAAMGFGTWIFAAVAGKPGVRRVWVHGRPILGFISGLLFGLGLTVLLQQFGVWPLTVVTAIVFPVAVAILTSVRAWLGRPYRIEGAQGQPTA